MTRVEREIVVNRPVQAVFDFFADGRNEPSWNTDALRMEKTSGGSLGIGTTFEGEGRMMGRRSSVAPAHSSSQRPGSTQAVSIGHCPFRRARA